MPKELHEIKNFESGTVTSVSDKDIQDDMATYSLNVDPSGEAGKLKGIPKDSSAIAGDPTVTASAMKNINDDGKINTVYFDDATSEMKLIENLHPGKFETTQINSDFTTNVTINVDVPPMQSNNKEVHIGAGDSDPIWAGKILNGQFTEDAPGYQCVSGSLEIPSSLGTSRDVVTDYNGDDSTYSLNQFNGIDKIANDGTVTQNFIDPATHFSGYTLVRMCPYNISGSYDAWILLYQTVTTVQLCRIKFSDASKTIFTLNISGVNDFDPSKVTQIKENATKFCVYLYSQPTDSELRDKVYNEKPIFLWKTENHATEGNLAADSADLSLKDVHWNWEQKRTETDQRPMEDADGNDEVQERGQWWINNNIWAFREGEAEDPATTLAEGGGMSTTYYRATDKIWTLHGGKVRIVQSDIQSPSTMNATDDGTDIWDAVCKIYYLDSNNRWKYSGSCKPIMAVRDYCDTTSSGLIVIAHPPIYSGSVWYTGKTELQKISDTGVISEFSTVAKKTITGDLAWQGIYSAYITEESVYISAKMSGNSESDPYDGDHRINEYRFDVNGIDDSFNTSGYKNIYSSGTNDTSYKKSWIVYAHEGHSPGSSSSNYNIRGVLVEFSHNTKANDSAYGLADGEYKYFYSDGYRDSAGSWYEMETSSGDTSNGTLEYDIAADQKNHMGHQGGSVSHGFIGKECQKIEFMDGGSPQYDVSNQESIHRFALVQAYPNVLPYGDHSQGWDYIASPRFKMYQFGIRWGSTAIQASTHKAGLTELSIEQFDGELTSGSHNNVYNSAYVDSSNDKLLHMSTCFDSDDSKKNVFRTIRDDQNYSLSDVSSDYNSVTQTYKIASYSSTEHTSPEVIVESDNNSKKDAFGERNAAPNLGIFGYYNAVESKKVWIVGMMNSWDYAGHEFDVNTHLVKSRRAIIGLPKRPMFIPRDTDPHGMALIFRIEGAHSYRKTLLSEDANVLNWIDTLTYSSDGNGITEGVDYILYMDGSVDSSHNRYLWWDNSNGAWNDASSNLGDFKLLYSPSGKLFTDCTTWNSNEKWPKDMLDTYYFDGQHTADELLIVYKSKFRHLNYDLIGTNQDDHKHFKDIEASYIFQSESYEPDPESGDGDFVVSNGDATNKILFTNTSVKGYISEYTGTADSSDTDIWTASGHVTSGVQLSVAEVGGSTSSTFMEGTKYFWKVSFLFDGYQETQLSSSISDVNAVSGSDPVATTNKNITITLKNPAISLSKRASHVKLYRASGPPNTDTDVEEGYYRLVATKKLDATWTTPGGTDDKSMVILDEGLSGATFEALTGMPESIYKVTPGYKLSAQINNQLFIGNCSHTGLDEPSNYIMKSKPYNFNQFDWTIDILKLPTTPTAMASFGGRIYAFDHNNTYRIEPTGLYIEDTFEGVGCCGPEAVIVTEYGMFYADNNNIYMHDGSFPKPIGNPILESNSSTETGRINMSWLESESSSIDRTSLEGLLPKLMFDSKRKALVVFVKSKNSLNYNGVDYLYFSWVYSTIKNRWDLWTFSDSSSKPKGILPGKNGEMFVSSGDKLINYTGDNDTRKAFSWESKSLTMGTDTQDKFFHKFRITGNPSGVLGENISLEIDNIDINPTGTISEFSSSQKKGKSAKIKLHEQTGNIDSIGTVFRRLRVK